MSNVYLNIDRILLKAPSVSLDARQFGAIVRSELQRVIQDAGTLSLSRNADFARVTALPPSDSGPGSLAVALAQSIGVSLRKVG